MELNKEINKKQIQILILKSYDKQKQLLHLYKLPNIWVQVLISQDWQKLRKLSLRHCGIGDHDIQGLTRIQLPSLKNLKLWNNKIEGRSLIQIVDIDFSNLMFLNLNDNFIGAKGAKILTKINLVNIKQLWLSGCKLSSEGAKQLFKGKWDKLMILGLFSNVIGLDGQCLCLGNWDNLRRLEITNVKYKPNIQFIIDAAILMNYFTFRSSKIRLSLWPVNNQQMRKNIKDLIERKLNKNIRN